MDTAFPWPHWHNYLEWVLEDTGLDFEQFCEKDILTGEMRYRKYEETGFKTRSGKAELCPAPARRMGIRSLPEYREPTPSPVSTPALARDYPLILTSGAKIRGFFHSEGRQIAPLRRRNPDPLVEMHPDTARSLGVRDGEWVWLESPTARVQMRAKLFDGIAPGVVGAQHVPDRRGRARSAGIRSRNLDRSRARRRAGSRWTSSSRAQRVPPPDTIRLGE